MPSSTASPQAIAWHQAWFAGLVPALEPFPLWTQGYRDWATSADQIKDRLPNPGFTWIQGTTATRGRLWGGCFEVLEMLKGTKFWPGARIWAGRVLFLETSEEKTPAPAGDVLLRNYGAQGVFDHLSALWIGRAKDYTPAENAELQRVVKGVVAEEWGAGGLPIVADLDFGHTDPRWALPLGHRGAHRPRGPSAVVFSNRRLPETAMKAPLVLAAILSLAVGPGLFADAPDYQAGPGGLDPELRRSRSNVQHRG